MPLPVDHFCHMASKNQMIRFQNIVFKSLVTDERMNGQTEGLTNGRREQHCLPPPASLV